LLPGPVGSEMMPALPHAFYREFTAFMFILAIAVVLASFLMHL
jgi:hypothetical protein